MRALTALVKREFLEHRIAFLYVPAILLILLGAILLVAAGTGHANFRLPSIPLPGPAAIYQAAIGGVFLLWSAYLLVELFFYYADSFSADRRNNALLFWKSMPQSDFKVLASKAVAGITVFLALITGFALLMGIVLYIVLLLASGQTPGIAAPGPIDAAASLVQMGIVGVIYLALTVLWYAPAFAWVAGLSTLFRRWSIPLALLIPGAVILLEYLNSLRGAGAGRPIADFLSWRLGSFPDESDAIAILITQVGSGPYGLIRLMLSRVDWLHMGIGLAFTVVVVFLGSEYRRRRIAA